MALSSSRFTPQKASILLIDDNSHGLGARKVVLEELGHQVTTARNAQEAMECLSREKFDLVITDYRMPGRTGTELIGWMREQGIDCPVILISGFVDTLGLTVANTGADVVIQKNAHEVNHMMRAVRSVLKNPPRKPVDRQLPPKPRSRKASS